MRGILGLAAFSAVGFLMATSAKADIIYDWTVSIPLTTGGTLAGSGQLVASNTISTSYDGKYTGYLVSSITGTYGGSTITGLAPVNIITNDNLINTSQALVDLDGIAFYVSPQITWDTAPIDLFYKPGYGYTDGGSRTEITGTFTLTAIPEPGTWPVLSLALIGIALLKRRNGLGPPAKWANR